MEVVEDFESRPRKAVAFPVERDKEIDSGIARTENLPKNLAGIQWWQIARKKEG